MKSEIKRKEPPYKANYTTEDYDIARNFSSKVYNEFGGFIRAIMIFGGGSPPTVTGVKGDIDILIIVDNVSFYLTPEIIETYRIIVEKCAIETSNQLHITTLRLTSFWEYVRVGDPIVMNMLRSGVGLIDTGFVFPLQLLLYEGRIRPTPESVNAYFGKSKAAYYSAKSRLLQGAMDLYWAVMDCTHAALMHAGEIPATPQGAADKLYERYVKTNKLDKKYPEILRKFYDISRKILHREIKEIKGEQFDKMVTDAKEFIAALNTLCGRKV